MFISMQGNWTVKVKAKNAAFAQRFVVSGATSGNGVHAGTPGNSVYVTGNQWTIAVQNNPGGGFQLSDSQITNPYKIGNQYVFDIQTNDAGGDSDFNDLILTCSTPATIFDYIVYGNVSLYSGYCIFNPCWRFPFVIDSYKGLALALKNKNLKDLIGKLYPKRILDFENPPPPDPPPFKPMVLDLAGDAVKPTTRQHFRMLNTKVPKTTKSKKANVEEPFLIDNFELIKTESIKRSNLSRAAISDAVVSDFSDLVLWPCTKEAGRNLTLTFEEYDPTFSERNGGPYVGNGHRELLGDTITDRHGNYIFRYRRFRFFPQFEQSLGLDAAAVLSPGFGPDAFTTPIYFDNPDIIVKVTSGVGGEVFYETAPYYDVPHLKRINICIPKSRVKNPSVCFNGNLVGSLGNVFVGGNQNVTGSTSPASLLRDGYNNVLTPKGTVTVHSSLAGFDIDCAAWRGTIDMKGCMYDLAKSASANKIKWYTIRVRRAGSTKWEFVSQNYKHPKFSKRNLDNYTGDDVGPFYRNLNVDGAGVVSRPAYINIQREVYAEGVDWEFSSLDRYMKLNTLLYDKVAAVRTPGTHYVRVDGYNSAGNHVAGATDLIALFIHNIPLSSDIEGNGVPNFALTPMKLDDPTIVLEPCDLYRLTDAQMFTPLSFSYIANDPYGFLYNYTLTMGRCPSVAFGMTDSDGNSVSIPGIIDKADPLKTAANVYRSSDGTIVNCPGYRGTSDEHGTAGMVDLIFTPDAGWIGATEYYTRLSLSLRAWMRVTNGYNTGVSSLYHIHRQIAMEKLNP